MSQAPSFETDFWKDANLRNPIHIISSLRALLVKR
jgi:hypothetical protein